MKTEIELDPQIAKKVNKLVEAGKYKDVNDFINRAVETLLMAEERVNMFTDVVRPQS